ncbi:DotU family type IV/VI secretion system protein [Pseudomonas sp. PDM05]|uniref:type VI secretion system protein TssL, short form n=1 Tax=Pseudomonas sp. PDM05 TaxID=2769301 RepID=UPI0017869EF3|nr:type VI secretion system protein TssL, short form [Pseudomonas sp. PDM05]MBD9461237.1 DotU family type IV/VI secretion system protein [Pseudomonas sp. PDM05]
MNQINSNGHDTPPADVDELLQDTYLLVVELRQGVASEGRPELWGVCVAQVEQVRQRLASAGMTKRAVDHISHAQCALLDETVLTYGSKNDQAAWAKPLQAKFFNHHQAGEFLYEDMQAVLREPAPDRQVLTVFHRVLMLGFQGRYRDLNDPERQRLLHALNAHVPPLRLNQSLVTQARGGAIPGLGWLQSPLMHVLAATVVLAATWWGLDQLLSDAVALLLPDQA